jgi:hypothetical protein
LYIKRAPNGLIEPSVRLGCFLRYVAGGHVYDIMLAFSIGRADVSKSIWIVLDAINQCDELVLSYPQDGDQQRAIAQGFAAKSSAGFTCCAGAVDGILIWTQRPSEQEAALSSCSVAKFFCGRKHKYGLNCQAICDARGRFLDVSVMYPASTSDVLSFESASIYSKLEAGLLAPGTSFRFLRALLLCTYLVSYTIFTGLCLFGDNAYINTTFMATPYSGTKGGTRDAYNFYHSQLQINIECAFGQFVHRWALFRSSLQQNVSLAKTSALVVGCMKLHNYCIDENDVALQSTQYDTVRANIVGAVPMVFSPAANMALPTGLMGGGEHWEDMQENNRRSRKRTDNVLPREQMHSFVVDKGLKRPVPTSRSH